MSINERGCLQLTAYGNTGTSLSSIFIGEGGIGQSATSAATRNIAIGHSSQSSFPPGYAVTTGDDNILIGSSAGRSVNSGNQNIAIGLNSGENITSANYNSCIGANSGKALTTGAINSFFGYSSGFSATTAQGNTAVGTESLSYVISTAENTAIGIGSGQYRGAGTNQNTDCIKCVYVGAYSRSIAAGGATNEIVIGYNAVGNGSNSVTLGHTTVTNTYLRGDINLVEGGDVVLGTSTGTQIGTSASQKLAFYGDTPDVQPTTAITGATFASVGAGANIKTDDTFGGYTIGQVVAALQRLGLLA